MYYLDKVQQVKCNAIIHTAGMAAGAVGAGLAQIPCSDSAVITPIQITMTIALGKVFGIEFSESAALASLAPLTAMTIGRTASQLLLGWIPVAGNIINACTAASLTETIGWMLVEDFSPRECAV